jgi:hypothetical protein
MNGRYMTLEDLAKLAGKNPISIGDSDWEIFSGFFELACRQSDEISILMKLSRRILQYCDSAGVGIPNVVTAFSIPQVTERELPFAMHLTINRHLTAAFMEESKSIRVVRLLSVVALLFDYGEMHDWNLDGELWKILSTEESAPSKFPYPTDYSGRMY